MNHSAEPAAPAATLPRDTEHPMEELPPSNEPSSSRSPERRTARERAVHAAEKRNQSDRRRLIDPTTCERDYTDEETEFMTAMERYKRENRRPFPTWSEVLEVIRSLGYRKVADSEPLPGSKPVKGSADKSAKN
ncbi:hypothetical protein [Tuwongella immobilis]|uniref:Uncharacterized protein n=1 Tax=Tuwongella immobilis TaxID=692036 RepID=A0A6C2YMW8_9BACT|nr:hypothetical protein [Tuwongella immobilis]VIP02948.1 Uncharacterized protein OS=Isosphaera pallida (strain ATCC 43644 / DSM 9630 / IS1B) GN=Isop_0155 PE=4 SV=1 [Tuwongella immobilis]VTS02932.1 Uncharacterized protein OS=Isosphaera pallida (strain ATCC 43644 / DSM 9630 / IS1B) GN=Isop_0155 PE=4 SV=1 [Tuwongella immobilis]